MLCPTGNICSHKTTHCGQIVLMTCFLGIFSLPRISELINKEEKHLFYKEREARCIVGMIFRQQTLLDIVVRGAHASKPE